MEINALRVKKITCSIIVALMAGGMFTACQNTDVNLLFSARELDKAEVYAHKYYSLYNDNSDEKNDFFVLADKSNEEIIDILSSVEPVRPFEEGEFIDYKKGDPFLLLKKKDMQYIFYFYDVEQFISVHSAHRYHPLLWVEKSISEKNGTQTSQRWHCTLSAADYARVINLSFNSLEIIDEVRIPMGLEEINLNSMHLFDGKAVLEEPLDKEPMIIETDIMDEDIMLDSEILVFRNLSDWYSKGNDPQYCYAAKDEEIRKEIIRVIISGHAYSSQTGLPEMSEMGGTGQPGIVMNYTTENSKIQHIVSFNEPEQQIDENYIYYDEPVLSVKQTEFVKEKTLYKAVAGHGYRYILSQDDYKWLYELTKN